MALKKCDKKICRRYYNVMKIPEIVIITSLSAICQRYDMIAKLDNGFVFSRQKYYISEIGIRTCAKIMLNNVISL